MQEKDGQMRQTMVYSQRRGRAKTTKFVWGGVITENLIQYLAFALMKWQADLIAHRYRVVLNTHDEHVIVVPKAEEAEATAFIVSCMQAVPDWLAGCPIDCEASSAERYGDC
jgi:hypothetical protein